jgi:hypothetical protein
VKESIREALLKRQPAVFRKAVRGGRAWVRGRGDEARMLPSFLIIGGQRCGTTSLYRYLSEHPDVHPGLVKEIQFFTLNYGKGVDWYRSQFPPESVGGHSFDASPYYLFHPAAPERASGLLPDARLIALLRNPVDRAFSHYQHNVGNGLEDLGFEEALEAEESRLAGDPGYSGAAHRRYSYVARGMYEPQLARWLDRYDRSALKVLVSEEFFADPAGSFAGVLRFLRLREFDLPSYQAYTRRGRWDGPPLSPETRRRLQEVFREPNRRLEALLGRSLPWE